MALLLWPRDLADCGERNSFNWVACSLHTEVTDRCFKSGRETEWNIDSVQVQFRGYSDVLVCFRSVILEKSLRTVQSS